MALVMFSGDLIFSINIGSKSLSSFGGLSDLGDPQLDKEINISTLKIMEGVNLEIFISRSPQMNRLICSIVVVVKRFPGMKPFVFAMGRCCGI